MPLKKHNAGVAAASEGLTVLHRCSFIEWQPSPVIDLASSGDGSLAVALRDDGDIELYEIQNSHCLQVR
jgi:hypothetical protein